MTPTLRWRRLSRRRCSSQCVRYRAGCCWCGGRDSGAWELPGGRVDVGESAVEAAVRETAEEAGLQVRITGFVGLFTDPAHVVRAASGGPVRQQFVVCFHGWSEWRRPCPDGREIAEAVWFDPSDVTALRLEPGARRWIHHALAGASEPHLE